ncbi:hypothetical protein N2152v2_001402 [Parachlorella kessleri]
MARGGARKLELATLRSSCQSALATMRMPTTRNEDFRFTDVTPILQSTLQPASPAAASEDSIAAAVARHNLKQPAAAVVVVVDGVVHDTLGCAGCLPTGVYVGGLEGAPKDVISFALGSQSRSRGGPFATLNGALAQDAVVVHIPANTTLDRPIHILYLSSTADASAGAPGGASTHQSTKSAVPVSAPRLLCMLEEGASAEVVEEFAPLRQDAEGGYLVTAVAEFELDDGSLMKHSYVQTEAGPAFHLKATLVNQGTESSYTLTEASLGGSLTRHDLGIEQSGPATQSHMCSFLLCGDRQLHDLHSRLRLDHPNGAADQLHKCIVSHSSGRGVFDGNVKVNRLAQKTDAQQLSRNLLLAPRATVNVKPNLQIIADDVKCTHGCAVSDLEEDELFYLRSRGISPATARQMLVYSFGREVVQGLKDEALMERVEAAVQRTLATVDILAAAAAVAGEEQ